MGRWQKLSVAAVALLVLIQFIPIARDNPPFDKQKEIQASQEVGEILKKACYDCHSNETKYSVYSYIAPLSWGVRQHIKDGRNAMNFSLWADMETKTKKMRIERLSQVVKLGFMPMGSYVLFHKEAKLTKDEERLLINWAEEQKSKY